MISPSVLAAVLMLVLSGSGRSGQHGPALRLEQVNDGTRDLMFTNIHEIPMRIVEVNVYRCVHVTAGCGTATPDLDVPAHHTVRLRRISVDPMIWGLRFDARWRPAPVRTSASVVLHVPAAGAGALLVAPLALTALGYHPIERSRSLAVWHMVDLARRLSLWIEQTYEAGSSGADSLRIELSGARLPIDAAGLIVADDDRWPTLATGDTADERVLQGAAGAVKHADSAAVAAPPDTAVTMHAAVLWMAPRTHLIVAPRDLGRDRRAVCRYSGGFANARVVVDLTTVVDGCEPVAGAPTYRYNALVTASPAGTPIGKTLEACAAYTLNVPDNWAPVDWYRDAARCPVDGPTADSTQPNILVLKRIY